MAGTLSEMFTMMDEVGETVQTPLTKSIAAQIIQSSSIRHPAKHYPVPEEDKLSETELIRLKGIYPWTVCAQKWSSFSGVEEQQSIQAKVDKKIVESRAVQAEVAVDRATITFVAPDDKVETLAITDGIPEIAGPFDTMIHRVAGLYYLLNPPFAKGEMMSTPVEREGQKGGVGMYVPGKCSPIRRWVGDKYIGPFEGVYREGNTVTVAQIEATMNTLPKNAREKKELYVRVCQAIGPQYNNSKVSAHKVFNLIYGQGTDFPVPTIDRFRGWINVTFNATSLWRQYLHFNNFARIRSAYEAYYYCLLPGGMAEKAHIVSNLKWVIRQVRVSGVTGMSGSSQWLYVKAFAAMNLAISSERCYEQIKEGEVGEFAPFNPVLRLEDMEGMAMPTATKAGTLQFTPANPGERLDTIAQRLKNMRLGANAYGVVSYYHPTLQRPDWAMYPLNLRVGLVVCVYDRVGGLTAVEMENLMSRFIIGRALFPYTRQVWPQLATEIVTEPITIRNGKKKEAEEAEDSSWLTAEGKMESISPSKLSAFVDSVDKPVQEIFFQEGSKLPLPVPPRVAPVSSSAPESLADVEGIGAADFSPDNDEEEEDLNVMLTKAAPSKAQVAENQAAMYELFKAAKLGSSVSPQPPPKGETQKSDVSVVVEVPKVAVQEKQPSSSSSGKAKRGRGKK